MDISSLPQFLDPESVAIVGLSADPTKHGGRVLANLRKLGYPGRVWGVNPKRPDVDGVEVFPALSEVPETPDLVVCAIPAAAVVDVVREAAVMEAQGVVVFAGGFAERGDSGRANQDLLSEVQDREGIRVLGPNSGGVIRPGRGVAISFLTCLDRDSSEIRSGPVGLVTQSGGTGSYIHNLAAARSGGLAASISTGNEVDVSLADGINALCELDEVRSIALVLEVIRDGSEFIEAVQRAHRLGKPVVACRLGTSDRSKRLMKTHTGAMAHPARVLDGVLDSLAVTIAETPAELLDVAEIMARTQTPSGARVGVVTHSGGAAILLTDLAERLDVDLPTPSTTLREQLDPLIQLGTTDNPVDMGAIIGGQHRFSQAVSALAGSGDYDMVLAVSTAHPPHHSVARVEQMLTWDEPVPVVHLWMAGDQGAEGLTMLRGADRAVTEEPRSALRALAVLARLSSYPRTDLEAGVVDADLGERMVMATTEHAAKEMLTECGFSVAQGGLASTAEEAGVIADELGGLVVLKISSPDIPHKTEVGGVRVAIRGGDHAKQVFEEMTSTVKSFEPTAHIEGVRVEHQHTGLDVIVGGVRDRVFGPMALVGLGGVAAEELDSQALAPLPLSREGADRLLSRVPGLRITLERHSARDDAAGRLAELLVAFGELVVRSGIDEIDLNPVTWTGSEWIILDALFNPGSGELDDSPF